MAPDVQSTDREQLVWKFDFAMSTFFEVSTDQVVKLLPKRFAPMEPAPGVSLINLTAFNFVEGALEKLPEFQELIYSVIVAPDLTRGVPNFAMFILSLASTNQDHLDHCVSYYQLPVFGLLNRVEIQRDLFSVSFADAAGPIVTLKSSHPEPSFEEAERYFQAFVEKDGELFVSDVHMRGVVFEHQDRLDGGSFQEHSFFRGIHWEGSDPAAFLHMITKPGHSGQQSYPRPEAYR